MEREWVSGKLPSRYHRDLQLTKEPTIHTAVEVEEMLPVASRVLAGFPIHRPRVTAAARPEFHATHDARRRVCPKRRTLNES
jgi:argininosuccinate lyase